MLVVIDLPDPKTGLRQLFPHGFFLVTNWTIEQRSAWDLLVHYRNRGTFEDRLGEFNACVGPSRPAGSFEANEAGLLLKLLAFNLAGGQRHTLGVSPDRPLPLLEVGCRVDEGIVRLGGDVQGLAGLNFLKRVAHFQKTPC